MHTLVSYKNRSLPFPPLLHTNNLNMTPPPFLFLSGWIFIQLKTATLLSTAGLLADDAVLNSDNLEYNIDNVQIDSRKQKNIDS